MSLADRHEVGSLTWALSAGLREIAIKGGAAHAEPLGDVGHRDRAGSQHGACGLKVGLGEFGRPATLTATREGGLQPFHGTFAVEIEEVFRRGAMHLQGEAAMVRSFFRTERGQPSRLTTQYCA